MASNFTGRPSTSNRDGRLLLLPEGDWTHVTQNAGGANFHLAQMGPKDGEPVILLHGFPRTWYSMRHALVALADAGFRAFAMDLRGFGTSDLQPHGQDPLRMSADVAAVIASLGYDRAHIIGVGMGGQLGWILAATNPDVVASLLAVAAPHPLTLDSNLPSPFTAAGRTVARIRMPWFNVRELRSGALIDQTTNTWSGPSPNRQIFEDAAVYRYAFSRPFAAETALEAVIRANALTKRTRKRIDTVVDLPISVAKCTQDPLRPTKLYARDQQWARQPITDYEIASGHFPTEETPEQLNDVILDHMQRVAQ
ncbi:MAG TPA: alpha/beta hydrolase [Actinomyces sp.]|jgi:pimeloyl-ACP methyl ester carboxylesterase|nr:alpha/beta hydrolase [Acidobacteriota bacterium]HHT40776.1 alpha/beta hydrolase [Actinomyces sp.]